MDFRAGGGAVRGLQAHPHAALRRAAGRAVARLGAALGQAVEPRGLRLRAPGCGLVVAAGAAGPVLPPAVPAGPPPVRAAASRRRLAPASRGSKRRRATAHPPIALARCLCSNTVNLVAVVSRERMWWPAGSCHAPSRSRIKVDRGQGVMAAAKYIEDVPAGFIAFPVPQSPVHPGLCRVPVSWNAGMDGDGFRPDQTCCHRCLHQARRTRKRSAGFHFGCSPARRCTSETPTRNTALGCAGTVH